MSSKIRGLVYGVVLIAGVGNSSLWAQINSGHTGSAGADPESLRLPSLLAPLSPNPKVGTNTVIGQDPAALPIGLRAQAEPYIARSYSDPGFVVATFQEGRYQDGGAFDCGYATSSDGGVTWNRALIPHLIGPLDNGAFSRASDPVVAIDLQNNVYLNVLAIRAVTPSVNGAVVVSRSTDRGVTFGPPLTVFSELRTNFFPDKNWLTVNTFPGTPTVNRLLATFTYFTPTNYVIYSSFSDDQGNDWSVPQPLSPNGCQGSQPVFLPDGSLSVLYWNLGSGWIEIVHSADGGGTYGSPSLVASVTTTMDPVARDSVLLPSLTTDRQNGVLYLTYKALFGWPRIMFTKSIDQGKTWSTPAPISDNPSGTSVFAPAIAVTPEGQHVSVVFYDNRNNVSGGALVDFYLAESFDGGATWGPNIRLTDVSSDLTLAPLTPQGRMFGDYFGIVPALGLDVPAVAIWIDTRNGTPDPFSARITRTQGATFAAWQSLRFGPTDLANPTVSGADADPNKSGLPNLLQYALGVGRQPQGPVGAIQAQIVAEPLLALTYSRCPTVSDVSFVWESSTNFAAWTPIAPSSEQLGVNTNGLTQPVKASFSLLPEPNRYHRFGASLNQPPRAVR